MTRTRFAAFCATVVTLGVPALTCPVTAWSAPSPWEDYLNCLKGGTPAETCCWRHGLEHPDGHCVAPKPEPILNNPGQSTRPPLPPVVGTDKTPVLTP